MRLKKATPSPGEHSPTPAGLSDTIIEAGLLISIIIAPLFFNPRTQHTFEPDKAALLRSVVLIALLAWLIRMNFGFRTLRRAQGGVSDFGIGLLRTPLVFPALLLLTAYTIGTATSVLPRMSFWGAYERGQGLYTFIAYVVLFLLVRTTLTAHVRRRLLLDTILLVSVPISVYAVLQRFGLDPLQFQTGGAAVTARAISTLGNPIFLGAYLIMVLPVTILRLYQAWSPGLALRSGSEGAARGGRRARADSRLNPGLAGIYGALLVLQLAALFFAQSRGPILGLIGGLGFGALVWAGRQGARRIVIVGGTLAILGVAAISLSALAPGTVPLGRLEELVDPGSRTGRQRLLVWEGTVDLAAAEPFRALVGYGPETLRDVIGPHMPAEIASLKPDEDFDRAHNAVLDLWATTGFLGVLAYLLVICSVLYYGLRILGLTSEATDRWLFVALVLVGTLLGGLVSWFGISRQWIGLGLPLGLLAGVGAFVVWRGLSADRSRRPLSGDDLLVIALLTAVVAHVVETLFGIAIVATQTLFWIYAALIAGLTFRDKERGRQGEGETRRGGNGEVSPLPVSPSPPLLVSTWGLVTGIALALFSYPLLTAGQARGGLAWGVTASVTLLFGLLRVLSENRDADGDPVVQYVGTAVAAVLAFLLLSWLPGPPFDITHQTVAVFVYVIAALITLAVVLFGVAHHVDNPAAAFMGGARQVSWWRGAVYGVVAIGTLVVIWLTNVNPVRADVFYKEGLAVSVAGSVQNATRVFEMSVALDPSEDRYHSGLGAAYVQMAQAATEPALREEGLSAAEVRLQEAQRLDPYRADHLRNLGVLYRIWAGLAPAAQRTSRLRQALTYYKQAAGRNPVNVRVWREWGETHAALGEWDAAVQRYDEALRLNDRFVETWLLLAEARLHQSDYAGARLAYDRALALDETRVLQKQRTAVTSSPEDPLPHQALALVYTVLGQSQAARAEADAARDLMAEEPSDWGRFLRALQ